MKTVLAQARKELAGASVLLWIWGVCVGIDCLGFLTRIPFHPGFLNVKDSVILFDSVMGGMTIAIAAFITQALLAIILLVWIVQTDPLTDSAAFWRTRPIARSELLTEKVLFAALFLAGGLLAAWAVRIPFGSWKGSGVTVVLHTVVFVSGLLAFAAVTFDFSKLILAFLALGWGAEIVAAILLALLKYVAVYAGISATSWPLAAPSFFASEHGHVVVSAFYLVAFLAIVVFQYLTLRTRVSRQLLFATFFMASAMQGNGGSLEFHSSRVSHVRGP